VGAGSSSKKRRRRLPRPHRPRASRLAGIAVLTGMVGAAAMLLLPVDAAVGSDPLLRLRTFDSAPAAAGTVDCGPVLGDTAADNGRADLYGMARDKACTEAADRRLLSAGAAAAVVALTGLLALAAASTTRAGR
jgi:hypothetical protein